MLVYAATISLSSFLLFLIQPVLAKQILPWFGGSAAVWTTCLVFFQFVLLFGYAYADWTTRRLRPRTQAVVHCLLLAASLALLPVAADPSWRPAGREDPALRILGLLGVTIGLPYFLLSTTGPLIQAWFARSFPSLKPYRLFALSNLTSMLGLLAFPFAIEPRLTSAEQSVSWSVAYGLFALLAGVSALKGSRAVSRAPSASPVSPRADSLGPEPSAKVRFTWFALGALGSFLLLAITNHVCLNIASIPFLWVAPLSLYLLSFILCFDGKGWYRRGLYLPLVGVLLALMATFLASTSWSLNLKAALPVYLAGLFACCMFCHGELAARKPAPGHLTGFYLLISLGGAVGALLVGVAAPYLLSGYFELGLGLLAVASVLMSQVRRSGRLALGAGLALVAWVAACWGLQIKEYASARRAMTRNFYGTLRSWDSMTPGGFRIRQFVHGAIKHGEQFLDPARRREPTSYYSPRSGVGMALRAWKGTARVGVVGMGAGAITVYGRPGDYYRLYEINPSVVDVARAEFTFLQDLRAKYDIVLGDGRLNLEREPSNQFDFMILDAFSGDAIPAHLITREAVAIYLRHLRPGGVLAFNATNRYLNIVPVVADLAHAEGLTALHVRDEEPPRNPDGYSSTDWMIVTANRQILEEPLLSRAAEVVPPRPGARLWTDDFNNLYGILK